MTQISIFEHRIFGVILDDCKNNYIKKEIWIFSEIYHEDIKLHNNIIYFLLIFGRIRILSISSFICIMKWEHEI